MLFELPVPYLKAMNDYENKYQDWKRKMTAIKLQAETIVLKIQLGSSTVLDKLVMQVDNMADLNIINTQLLLSFDETKK